MSLQGNLTDIAVVDLLQFVHLSGRSGTLELEREGAAAYISFHRGKIVAAWCPAAPSVCNLLIAAGLLHQDDLDDALDARAAEVPPPSLGQVLVTRGAVSADALRDAIIRKVEHAVYDLVTWRRGVFRFIVDEIRGDLEIALAPGDVIPQLDLNTQTVLMEALRLFDERDRNDARTTSPPIPAPALAPALAMPGRAAPPHGRSVQVVTSDRALAEQIRTALGSRVASRAVPLRDAGIPTPGEAPPLVVVDCRPGGVAVSALRRLHDRHPRSLFVAMTAPAEEPAAYYVAGAVVVVPAHATTVAACCANLAGTSAPEPAPGEALETGLARLRRVIGDVRGGLLSATMSLNLMTIVADSVDRAVLFVIQRDALVGLGAFGTRDDGGVLAATTRGMVLAVDRDGPIAACMTDGRARPIAYDDAAFPAQLRAVIDRPRSGQAVLFPVLGSRRVVALIYADNGDDLRPIDDVEIVEIATAQVGLAFENELLRRQLERAPVRGAS
jgi:hypothetical protein